MINGELAYQIFEDRYAAAHELVPYLKQYSNNPDTVIIAIPRGGLELGYVLAKELHLPLDVALIKKIGFPGQPEYAMGAVSLEYVYLNDDFKNTTDPELKQYISAEVPVIQNLLKERSSLYRGSNPPLDLTNKVTIVVDDGVATGSTLIATLILIKKNNPKKIIVALPVSPHETLKKLQTYADEIICLITPEPFFGVGQVYRHFNQVDDQEAVRLLHEANI